MVVDLQLPMQSVHITTNVPLRQGVLDITLCDKDCQLIASDRWFSPSTPVSFPNKTDRHGIAKILLKVTLNIITLSPN